MKKTKLTVVFLLIIFLLSGSLAFVMFIQHYDKGDNAAIETEAELLEGTFGREYSEEEWNSLSNEERRYISGMRSCNEDGLNRVGFDCSKYKEKK